MFLQHFEPKNQKEARNKTIHLFTNKKNQLKNIDYHSLAVTLFVWILHRKETDCVHCTFFVILSNAKHYAMKQIFITNTAIFFYFAKIVYDLEYIATKRIDNSARYLKVNKDVKKMSLVKKIEESGYYK